MDIYIISMDRELNVSTIQKLNRGIHNSYEFHMLCFEDNDKSEKNLGENTEFIRFFIPIWMVFFDQQNE